MFQGRTRGSRETTIVGRGGGSDEISLKTARAKFRTPKTLGECDIKR
jgi:hypothetical protein